MGVVYADYKPPDGRIMIAWLDDDGVNLAVMPLRQPMSLWDRLRVAWHCLLYGVFPDWLEPMIILDRAEGEALLRWLSSQQQARNLN